MRRRGTRPTATVAAAALLALTSAASWAVPVAAAPAQDVPAEASPADPIDLREIPPLEAPGLDLVLDGVEVEGTAAVDRADAVLADAVRAQSLALFAWTEAEQERGALLGRATSAGAAVAEAQRQLADAQAALVAATEELGRRELVQAARRADLATEQAELRQVAAAVYTSTPHDAYAVLGSLDDLTEADRRTVARDRGVELSSARVDAARAPWVAARAATRQQAMTVARREAAAAAALGVLREATAERDRFDELVRAADETARTRRAEVDRTQEAATDAVADRRAARAIAPVVGLDMPLVALHAYWRGSALAPCPIPWWLLAGVGRVETRHATSFGSRLDANGQTSIRIIGIPLDGRPGVAAIGDTDGGRLDGDAVWDRAVGPMQFIPGTWARWATDGNADGEADPHNLYDAAGAAASYLCFGRSDLTEEPAMRAALLSYNRSIPYGNQVLDDGRRYRGILDSLPDVAPQPGDPAPDASED